MRDLVALLLPPICVLCGGRASEPFNLCPGCIRDLPRIEGACRRCALPLAAPGPEICARCTVSPPPFRRTVAAFRYADPVDTLIRQLKYRRDLTIAPTLGALLAERLEDRVQEYPQCILPVPLHPRRLRARGFNQSLEIAKVTARRVGLPVKRYWLKRVRDTPLQSQARSIGERQRNVKGAFTASPRLSRFSRVAILDDVVTTGSTAAELARVVLACGVESVDLWCAARAEREAPPLRDRSESVRDEAPAPSLRRRGWRPRGRWTR